MAAIGFVTASFVFGAMMWCGGLGVTYEAWGMGGVIIGLVIAGVGIVPVGMLAVLLHGEWQALIVFVILIVLTFGLRGLGFWLAKKVDERAARLSFRRGDGSRLIFHFTTSARFRLIAQARATSAENRLHQEYPI